MLATWSPVPGGVPGAPLPAGAPTREKATTTLYLVDPAGGRYAITTFPPPGDQASPALVDWSGDGSHALFAAPYFTPPTAILVDLHTGKQTTLTLQGSPRYTRPNGKALLLSTSPETGSGPATLNRVDLTGNHQLTYPTDKLGSPFNGSYLSTPDGTQLVLGRKAQAGQDLGGAGRRGIGVDRIQAMVNVTQLVAIGLMLGFGQKAQTFGIGLQHGVEQAGVGAGRFLGDRAHPPGRWHTDLAVILVQPPQNHVEQGGFARAITPHQADAAAGRQVGSGAGQDFPSGNPNRDVINRKHLLGLITVLALSSSPLHKAAAFHFSESPWPSSAPFPSSSRTRPAGT